MGFHVVEFVVTFVEIITGIIICQKALLDRTKIRWEGVCGAIISTIVVWSLNQLSLFSWGITAVAIVGITISVYVSNKLAISDAFIFATFFYVLVYMVDFLTIAITGIIINQDQIASMIAETYSLLRVYMLIFSKGILVGISLLLMKTSISKINIYIRKLWIGIVLCIIMIYFLVQMTFQEVNINIVVIWFLFFAFFIFIIYSISQYIKYNNEKVYLNIALEHNELQIAEYNRLINLYQENYTFIHDMKNQYIVLSNLIEKKEYEQAESLIKQFAVPSYEDICRKRTGILSVDIILNYKIKEAEQNNIKIKLDVDFIHSNISEQELTAILGNALDNAIEACKQMKQEDKWIDIFIGNHYNRTTIKIVNSYEIQPIKNKEKFISIKNDNFQLHGQGISIMKAVTEKNGGTMKIEYTNDAFSIVISFFC